MKRNLSHISIPFPVRLMSTNRTPVQMGVEFTRELKNMYAQQGGAGFKRNGISKVGIAIENETIVNLMHYTPVNGDVQILAISDAGKIYLQQIDKTWLEVYNGLSNVNLNWAHYSGKLIICNGVDKIMSWDGSSIKTIYEFVNENGINLTYIANNKFSIESDASLYPNGKELRLSLSGGGYVNVSVNNSIQSGNVTTVTTNENIITNSLSKIEFKEYPPTFNFIYAAHDRLWGMGNGALKANSFSNSSDREIVFYTNSSGDETDWRDANGAMQYINLADKMPVLDEVMAMAVKDSMTIFFGRNYIQIWSGYDPTLSGDMSWNKTIPLGLVHRDLIAEMPNDIAFFTRFGVRTISRVLQTEQLDISDLGSEIDSSISLALKKLTNDDVNYSKALSFRHDNQGWFGFKIIDESFIFQLSSSSIGWSIFDGAFSDITASLNTPNGKLYLAIGGQLYIYDESVFSDDGLAINTKWWTPWIKPNSSSKRWANKYVEVITEQGEPLTVSVKRFKNYNNTSFIESNVTVHKAEDFWDSSSWDSSFWDYGYAQPEKIRDSYIADIVSYSIETSSINGPFTVYGLKLFGIQEK